MKTYTCCIAAIVLLPMCSTSDPGAATASTASATSTPAVTTADTTPAPASTPNIFTSVGDTVKPEAPNAAFYDFGTLSLARTEPIRHDFKLHNASGQTINIARVQAACGCTTATSDLGVPGDYKPVAPGQDFTIGVSVDPAHLYLGSIDKMVWVYVTNQTTPAFTLHMNGTMTAAASFSPAVLNFGTVHAGTPAVQKLTVTIDESVYGNNPPDPISTNPDVRLKRVQAPSTDPAAANQVLRSYDVSITPHAHIGSLQGTIAMPQPGKPTQQSVGGPSVFVTGDISGDLSAAPQSVAFGAVTKGKAVTQQIVLTGTSPQALQGLRVKSGNKDITGSIKDAKDKSAVLEVTFDPNTLGSMQSQVTVVTKSGQQLDLPVWAWVNQ